MELPTHIMEDVLYFAATPFAFLVSTQTLRLRRAVVMRLVDQDIGWLRNVDDMGLALDICLTKEIDRFEQLNALARNDKKLATLVLERSDGYQYEYIGDSLARDDDIILQAIRLTDGYIHGLLPSDLQKSKHLVKMTAQTMGIEPPVDDPEWVEESTLDDVLYVIGAICQEAWEDFP